MLNLQDFVFDVFCFLRVFVLGEKSKPLGNPECFPLFVFSFSHFPNPLALPHKEGDPYAYMHIDATTQAPPENAI